MKDTEKRLLRRFLVFQFPLYSAKGGWDDFVNSYDTLEEAKKWQTPKYCTQIIDIEEGEFSII